MNCLKAILRMQTLKTNVDIAWVEFNPIAAPARLLGSQERRPAAGKCIEAHGVVRDAPEHERWINRDRVETAGCHAGRRAVVTEVAAGRLDAFWETGLAAWDIAAGALLIREAGGIISGLDGSENYLDTGHVLAGTPKIYGAVARLFAPHIREMFADDTRAAG